MSIFSRLKYGSYEDSSKASVYEQLAKNYHVSPQHVYEIAHGKKVKTSDDRGIFNDLLDKGIIVQQI